MHLEQRSPVADPAPFRLRHLLATNLAELTDEPDPIVIDTAEDGKQITFTITVPKSEIGKVIGQNGRMARTLRIVMGAAAAKYKRTCSLDIRCLEEQAMIPAA